MVTTATNDADDVLWHYCSNATFQSILLAKDRKPSIWLSALSQSNDSEEGRVLFQHLARLAETDKRDGQKFLDHLKEALEVFECVGMCLSKKRDLLSQWRGYASDGHGISIGFRRDALLDAAKYKPHLHSDPRLIDVTYLSDSTPPRSGCVSLHDHVEQEYAQLRRVVGEDNHCGLTDYIAKHRWDSLYALKAEAFVEESEVRLIGYLPIRAQYGEIQYRGTNAGVIPYVVIPLPNRKDLISEIVLGPKNTTPPHIVSAMCRDAGLESVVVTRSKASYR
jgi:hypothetical protein